MFLWGLILAAHLLGVTAWVGGMFYALAVLRPSLTAIEPSARPALHQATLRRFFLVVWHAMPLVLLTGYAVLFGLYGGFQGVGWPVHAMSLLGLVMAGVFLWIFFGPWARYRRAAQSDSLERVRRLVTLNLALGVLTIVLGALGHFG